MLCGFVSWLPADKLPVVDNPNIDDEAAVPEELNKDDELSDLDASSRDPNAEVFPADEKRDDVLASPLAVEPADELPGVDNPNTDDEAAVPEELNKDEEEVPDLDAAPADRLPGVDNPNIDDEAAVPEELNKDDELPDLDASSRDPNAEALPADEKSDDALAPPLAGEPADELPDVGNPNIDDEAADPEELNKDEEVPDLDVSPADELPGVGNPNIDDEAAVPEELNKDEEVPDSDPSPVGELRDAGMPNIDDEEADPKEDDEVPEIEISPKSPERDVLVPVVGVVDGHGDAVLVPPVDAELPSG